jgi:L-threonylcarbamoyladenylate synthase
MLRRSTRILSIDRDDPDPRLIDEAARLVRGGGLVAFATETVYGLGADATDPEAVAGIFEAKGRPAFNPLIVHADGVAMARTCVASWPDPARRLAERFWPGPLTLVLPRSRRIPDVVTAGRATVGVRIPSVNVARRLIESVGRPIAAPSANRSTGISPTLASHVAQDLDGRIDLILDSGQTAVGLESTVVDLTQHPPRVLRPGPILALDLARAIGGLRVDEAVDHRPTDRPASPGQMAIHYAPRTRSVRVEGPRQLSDLDWPERAALVVVGSHALPDLPASSPHRFDLTTPEAATRDLYVVLHRCDALGLDLIVVVPPPDRPEWRAVRDRLWRATLPIRP